MVDRPSVIAARCCEGIVTSISCGSGKRTMACDQPTRRPCFAGCRHSRCLCVVKTGYIIRLGTSPVTDHHWRHRSCRFLNWLVSIQSVGGLFFVTVTVDVTVKCGFVVVK